MNVAPLPVALLTRARGPIPDSCARGTTPEMTAELEAEITAMVDAYPAAVEGDGGDGRTLQLGMRLRDRGLSPDQAWPFMQRYNQRCEPQWPLPDLRKKLDNAYKYARNEPGDLRLEQARLKWAKVNGASAFRVDRFGFERAADLLLRVFAALVWFICGFVPEASVIVIAGEPKTSKTWLAITMAIAVGARQALFGVFGVPANERRAVAYFALEDSERSFRTRLAALARGMGLDPADAVKHIHVRCRSSLNLLNDDDLCGLLAACPDNLALLVIDPFRDAHTGEENSSGEMAEVMRRLRFLRDALGCSVIIIHHSAKAGPDKAARRPGQLMRGSSAVHGAVDGGIYLSMTKASENEWVNTVTVELKAGRGAGKFRLTLNVEDDENGEAQTARWTFDRETDAAGEDIAGMVLSTLEEGGPSSGSGLARRLHRSKAAVLQACTDLEADGRISRIKGVWQIGSEPVPEPDRFRGSRPLRAEPGTGTGPSPARETTRRNRSEGGAA